MKNELYKLAYALYSMGFEKEAEKIDKMAEEQENDAKDKKKKTKRDACYYKVKSRYDTWPSAYACVPVESSKALTRDGWKRYFELKEGEEILTYSLERDQLEFNKILNLHHYKDAETIKVQSGNTAFKIECTRNHKWVLKLPKTKTGRRNYKEVKNDMVLMEISEILKKKRQSINIVTSSVYNNSNNENKKDIIYKYGTNWIKYLLDSSLNQIQSWLFSAIVYDGNQRKIQRLTPKKAGQTELDYMYTSHINSKQSFGFKQKDKMHRDAFLLSAFLNGGQVSWKNGESISSCSYSSNKNTRNITNFKEIGSRKCDVWCPETKNGTWVMQQETEDGGVITITGNSGALVKCRQVGAKNWGEGGKKKKKKKSKKKK